MRTTLPEVVSWPQHSRPQRVYPAYFTLRYSFTVGEAFWAAFGGKFARPWSDPGIIGSFRNGSLWWRFRQQLGHSSKR